MNTAKFEKLTITVKDNSLNNQVKFPFDGLCFISIKGSAPFSYHLRSIDTDTWYSDKPILCKEEKELLPFGSYKGRIFSFDFHSESNQENSITVSAKFERPFKDKYYTFREYTLDFLRRKESINIKAGETNSFPILNFLSAHFEIHKIYSTIGKRLLCKVKYHNSVVDIFPLEDVFKFKKPWVLNWPDQAEIFLTNEGRSDLTIRPEEIYLAGYRIPPLDILEKVAPINTSSTFLIEGIRLGYR